MIDAGAGPKFDNLVVILMENHSLNEIYGPATYMTQLADQNVLLQNYSAIDHPSEPNYLAIASGQTFNPPSGDDNYHVFTANNLVDGLESVGKTWTAYSESASGPCDKNNPDIRHVPFIFFADVAMNATRCNRIVPTTAGTDTEVVAELNSATPSNFIWLTPNDSNNMHSGTVARGDAYLQALVPQILGSTTFMTKKAALFIVFDEGSGSATFPSDPVYAVWAGPTVKKGVKSTTLYSHYSVLSTLEANWGFASLGAHDVGAPSMLTEVFQ
jgi:acid phosphatase